MIAKISVALSVSLSIQIPRWKSLLTGRPSPTPPLHHLGFKSSRKPWREFLLTMTNILLLLGEKSSSVRFSHLHCLSLGHFPCSHHCQPGQLPRLTDRCVSCGRSNFGVVDENDASIFQPSAPEAKLPLSSASGIGVESRGCASPGRDASKQGCIVGEIHDGRA